LTIAAAQEQIPKPGILQRYLPILSWLPGYRKEWLAADAVAGLSVWALLVPQGLAYATIAGVPVQYGLYTAFAALIAYAIFGTSRQMVQGPSAAVAAVSAASVAGIIGTAALGTNEAAVWTAALALTAAVLYLALGVARMGWVSNFLSKAVMAGFVLGFSLGIIVDQSYKLFGVEKVEGTYFQKLIGTIEELPKTSGITLLIGALSLAALLAMRRYLGRLPRALIVMALAILAVSAFDLADHGVKVTGSVPTGLFSIGLPDVGWTETAALVAGGFSVIFVGFSESLASARAMARKHGYRIDTNQELIAQGASCGAGGLVGGFATDGSLSKTSVADAAGQKTQMASLINAVFVLLTILVLARLFENLPSAVLGAVVIDAMVGLIAFAELARYYRVNRADWVFYMGAALGIFFVGIIQGILIGVVLSLLLLIARASKPALRRLGRDPDSGSYLDVERHEGLETDPGVLAVRLDGPLFFADANRFRDEVKELVEKAEKPVRLVVIDADAISQTDTDGADVLIELADELKQNDAALALSRVQPQVLRLWRSAGVLDEVDLYDTVRAAADRVQEPIAST
jgi:SulP family sulfate permease